MDPATHMLITGLVVGHDPASLLASVGPDLPWYVLYPAWLSRQRGVKAALRNGEWPLPPKGIRESHYAGHSLLVSAGAFLLIRVLFGRRYDRLALAWVLHILLDMPTHSRQRMGTRVLWPISAWAYDGISWGDGVARLIARIAA